MVSVISLWQIYSTRYIRYEESKKLDSNSNPREVEKEQTYWRKGREYTVRLPAIYLGKLLCFESLQ